MNFENYLSGWDLALIVVVSIMGTAVAYLKHPERKAFVLMLPIPFTLALLSSAQSVGVTHMLGLALLFAFSCSVWALHVRLRWPIVLAIAMAAVSYCLVAMGITWLDLGGEPVFWSATILILALAVLFIRVLPVGDDPHSQTRLPVWIKLPAIMLIVTGLIAMKATLAGFFTTAPMVLLLGAYESRRSLWTIVRMVNWVMLLMAVMLSVIRLTQDYVGLSTALLLSWSVHLLLLCVLRRTVLPRLQERPEAVPTV